jgi:carboxymethylenebutenolidase
MAMIEIQTLGATAASTPMSPNGRKPRAAIVLIQEIFGVNEGIRRKCDTWAEQGYLALAPDLFWRLEPGTELDPDVPEQFQRALELMGAFNQDQGIRDIEASIRRAQRQLRRQRKGRCRRFLSRRPPRVHDVSSNRYRRERGLLCRRSRQPAS